MTKQQATQQQPSLWLTVKDVAEMFSVSRQTAYNFVRDLPCTVRVGRQIRVSRPALLEHLQRAQAEKGTNREALIRQRRPHFATHPTPRGRLGNGRG